MNYINNYTLINIKCKQHDIFKRTPQSHLNGAGCDKCDNKKSNKKLTQEEFIERANEIHKSKYDYSRVIYVNMRSRVKIICPIHKKFKQRAKDHLNGCGCVQCSHQRYTTEEWIEIAKGKHNNFYDYSLVDYKLAELEVTIICSEHGKFEQRAGTHLKGGGCIKCGRRKQASKVMNTLEDFIFRSLEKHGNEYDYSETEYDPKKVSIRCAIHGIFRQNPHNHMRGKKCKKCSNQLINHSEEKRLLREQKFIKDAIDIYGDIYDYSKLNYINSHTEVRIICKQHKSFYLLPYHHLHSNCGCPKCLPTSYSKVSIDWLKHVSLEENIKIKHFENSGEFKIPNSNYKADGYCKKTNTIYEFHGCFFHGCQDCFDYDKENKLIHKTFGELYEKTKKREKFIKEQGFNLVTIWEHEWRKQVKNKTVINT